MRTLLVMRHGKSDWRKESSSDHDRPLAPRGIKAAARIGRLLTICRQAPDLVITSTAIRAATTAHLAAEAGSWSCDILERRALYEEAERGALAEVRAAESSFDRILVIGHEPWVSSLTARLIGATPTSIRFPTAAVACVELPGMSWSDIGNELGQLAWFTTPRLLKLIFNVN